jgi:tRNA pseudouridine55 synthase
VIRQKPFDAVTFQRVEETLASFVGTLEQIPPMYSAVRHQGRRLYELARKGIEVERKSRLVELSVASVISFESPYIVADIRCGHGFYARTLAHDLGGALGTVAHLSGLARTRAGKFKLADARTISEIEGLAKTGDWREALLPIDFTLDFLPRVDLDPLRAEMVRHGRQLSVADLPAVRGAPEKRVRVYEGHELLGLLRFDSVRGLWQPEKVLPPA